MNYNKFSNYFGLIAEFNFPKWIQNTINKLYVWKFDIDLKEFDDIKKFDSLNALFTRKLLKNRILSDGFISPCDGLCLECRSSNNHEIFSIKNHTYNVNELLSKTLNKDELQGNFEYVNIYLSPRDYHHYHAPCDLKILSLYYKPGKLFSVAPKWLKKVENLYCKNERVIIKARLENKKILWIVFVGALNVGKMKFDFEPRITTNANLEESFYEYSNLNIEKGDHIGNFELGSTIVLITQDKAISYLCKANDRLKFGNKIANIF